ncbi:DUF3999 domain-containing protein [uncultured Cedecea sp.]|uniref:DUF3999 domain-containing protein n=1 Tax=uncultured Cedecea sp. TaxID=988762 RepID=UPI0026126EEB|nr:DUF3999 domain-containing protein [uncultured Cedecea sp.]
MKGLKHIVFAALFCSTLPVQAAEQAAETPQDYAFGAALTTPSASLWYHLALPEAIYQQSSWPDLRDVRVFNQQGESMPFALQTQMIPSTVPEPVELRLFPLDISPLSKGEESGEETVVLRGRGGVEITLRSEAVKSFAQSWLLMLPEDQTSPLSVSQLRLNWTTPTGNWQGKMSVWSSRDLNNWSSENEGVIMMDLTSGTDKLRINALDLDLTMSASSRRYLLLVADSTQKELTLTQAEVIRQSTQPRPKLIEVKGSVQKVSDREVVWQWAQPQPLTSLRIALNSEGIVPADLAWRDSAKGEWMPLKKEVLYRLKYQQSEAIALSGQPVQAVKMTVAKAHLLDELPDASGSREEQFLTFNAQGKGPYLLAWGNGAALHEAVPLDTLIPAALRKNDPVDALPWATEQETITLGGEARLTATSVDERESQWKTLLVWGVLILGVLVLAGMAWRIWREVKDDKTLQ